ncbi:MAG: type II secretion system protein [Planctomycetota bacterium]
MIQKRHQSEAKPSKVLCVDERSRLGSGRCRGLTLLELIVVLAILAALGTVMVTQTTGLADETRYTQTARTLEGIQDAVIGRSVARGEDPTAVLPGFVSDMGRLPQATADLSLAELWDTSLFADADLYAVRTLAGLDDDLQMASGWRGPYVRLPVGTSDLRNGWGRAYDLFDEAGAAVTAATDSIGLVSSTGSGLGDAFDPTTPLEVVFSDSSVTPTVDRVTGSVPTMMLLELTLPPAGTASGVVRLYGIQNGTPTALFQSVEFTATGTAGDTTTVAVTFTDPDPLVAGLNGISIGPKVLRAYQYTTPTAPAITDNLTALNKSDPVRFTLPAGGLSALPSMTLVGN